MAKGARRWLAAPEGGFGATGISVAEADGAGWDGGSEAPVGMLSSSPVCPYGPSIDSVGRASMLFGREGSCGRTPCVAEGERLSSSSSQGSEVEADGAEEVVGCASTPLAWSSSPSQGSVVCAEGDDAGGTVDDVVECVSLLEVSSHGVDEAGGGGEAAQALSCA
jgi:hypothetical protein